jgi:serine phosphatase RsbU (regulator of sigma subunit)
MSFRQDDLATLRIENSQLRRAVQELSTLNDLSRAIGASMHSEEVMQTIISRSLRAVNAEEGVVTLLDRGRSTPEASRIYANTLVRTTDGNGGRSSGRSGFHATQALLGWMQLNKRPLAIADTASDPRFRGVAWDANVRSVLCVPLLIKSELTGVLAVYNKKDGQPFDADDERLLAIIASQSAQIVDNARLYEEEKALFTIREQMRLTAEIQAHLLPSSAPAIAGYEVAGRSVAAQEMGGDYFDYNEMPNGGWSISVGDVAGKGLPASMLMANVQGMIRLLSSLNVPPAEVMRRANELLCRSTPPHEFVTFFFATLDPASHALTFCNAGHNPALHFTAGGIAELATRGTVLGMFEELEYGQDSIVLAPGDIVAIYSDGVTEAIDPDEREFGEQRLIDVVNEHRGQSAAVILDALFDAVARHQFDQPPFDDTTAVIIKRT